MNKHCYKCGQTKPIDEFNKNRSKKDGHADECRECNRQRMHAWSKENRERVLQSKREYYAAHKEQALEYCYEWRRNNHDRFLEYIRKDHKKNGAKRAAEHREWRARRSDELRRSEAEYHKNWLKTHPENRKAHSNNRRARLFAGGTFTPDEWVALCEQYGNKCLKCGSAETLVADHVIPLARGGKNTIDNIQPLCWRCNLEKHAKTVDYRVKQ